MPLGCLRSHFSCCVVFKANRSLSTLSADFLVVCALLRRLDSHFRLGDVAMMIVVVVVDAAVVVGRPPAARGKSIISSAWLLVRICVGFSICAFPGRECVCVSTRDQAKWVIWGWPNIMGSSIVVRCERGGAVG